MTCDIETYTHKLVSHLFLCDLKNSVDIHTALEFYTQALVDTGTVSARDVEIVYVRAYKGYLNIQRYGG